MNAPDEEVAENILGKFREAKILSEKGINKLLAGLSAGTLTSEDWRLAFETENADGEVQNANNPQ